MSITQRTKSHRAARLRLIMAFLGVAFVIALVFSFRNQAYRHGLQTTIDQLLSSAEALDSSTKFGDFTSQDVDSFIQNLNHKIESLRNKQRAYQLISENSYLFNPAELQINSDNLGEANELINYYLADRGFMGMAWLDYNVLRRDPQLVEIYHQYVQTIATFQNIFGGMGSNYVRTGQIIGTQGCTGVCSGTHLHFVVKQDGKTRDACEVLPRRRMSSWGVVDSCGVLRKEIKVAWPMLYPWIVTQEYGVISSVVGNVHDGLDVIDRELAPVLAAHSGWLYTESKDCTGAVICNKGASNIARICETKNCRSGLVTEYWHLTWMLEPAQ